MRYRIFYAALVLSATPCHAQTAQELSKLAKQYEQEGKLELAVAHAEKAAQADPKNWRLAWDLGEMLLYKTTDREKALTTFTDALNRGYTHPIVYHKQAMCHFHLGHYTTAIDLLNRSIMENKELLRKAEKAKDKGT